MSITRFKLVFYVPATDTRRVLDHLFQRFPQELGKIGDYEQCAFIARGTEQFKPCPGAHPVIGSVGQLQFVEGDRVELVINDKGKNEEVRNAIRELKSEHPYEEVAYDVYRLEDF